MSYSRNKKSRQPREIQLEQGFNCYFGGANADRAKETDKILKKNRSVSKGPRKRSWKKEKITEPRVVGQNPLYKGQSYDEEIIPTHKSQNRGNKWVQRKSREKKLPMQEFSETKKGKK